MSAYWRLTLINHKHLASVSEWIDHHSNVEVLNISYNDMLKNPTSEAEKLNRFLGQSMKVEEMVAIVDPDLYRNRKETANTA